MQKLFIKSIISLCLRGKAIPLFPFTNIAWILRDKTRNDKLNAITKLTIKIIG